MSAREPRFEVVRSDAGWHARFRAANGRIVWVTESYQRRGKALRAITLLTGEGVRAHGDTLEVVVSGTVSPFGLLEVREVDERTAVTA